VRARTGQADADFACDVTIKEEHHDG
jgi:hypothetical protein